MLFHFRYLHQHRQAKQFYSPVNKEIESNKNHTKLILGRNIQITVLMKGKSPGPSNRTSGTTGGQKPQKFSFGTKIRFLSPLWTFKRNLLWIRFSMKAILYNWFVTALQKRREKTGGGEYNPIHYQCIMGEGGEFPSFCQFQRFARIERTQITYWPVPVHRYVSNNGN